jgi:hypothetical protein
MKFFIPLHHKFNVIINNKKLIMFVKSLFSQENYRSGNRIKSGKVFFLPETVEAENSDSGNISAGKCLSISKLIKLNNNYFLNSL